VERFFLNPWALAFAALSGGIVLMYILKLRRSKVRVSSTLLWERTVHDTKANAPWQKLRFNWLMVLQILALCLLALALARPFIFGTAATGGRTVIVIDTSASMLATDVAPSRLDQALEEARRLIGDMKPSDEAMLIAAGPEPRILSSFTRDKGQLQRHLREARTYAGATADLNAALKLASSVSTGQAARAVVISDGAVGDLDPFATGDLKLDFLPVGSASANIAIVGAGARRNAFDDRYEIFVALHSFVPDTRDVDVVFSAGGETLDAQQVRLEPGKRAELTLPNLPYIPDPVTITADVDDQLAADNAAHVVMPRQVRYNVVLARTGESLLLRKVLSTLQEVDVYDLAAGDTPPDPVHVYVVDGNTAVPADPTASYLYIDTTSHAFVPVQPGEVAELNYASDPPVIPAVVGMQRSHPLLRYVNIADLRLGAMRRTEPQPWGRVVVDGTEGPLIVEGLQEGQRTVYLAFDIYKSDFPLRASFPMFMANAVRYLGEASTGAVGRTVSAGERVDLLAPIRATRVEITEPGGSKTTADLTTRDFTLAHTERAGIYQVRYFDEDGAELGAVSVPVSLLSDAESNLAPAQTLRVRGAEEALATASAEDVQEIVGRKEVRVNREFYTWLILAVLLIISVEWFLYHQRTL
jgi:Ca-activated chloride channel homolog